MDDLKQRLRGRALFCRNRGEAQTAQWLDEAAAALDAKDAEILRLRAAIRKLVPGHRDPEGGCWCHWGHNPDYGHTASCQSARAALDAPHGSIAP